MHRPSQTVPTQQDEKLYELAVRKEHHAPGWLDYCFEAFRVDASERQAEAVHEFAQRVSEDWQRRWCEAVQGEVPDITPILHHASEQIRFALSKEVGDLPIFPTSDDEAGRIQKLGNFLLFHTARQRSSATGNARWTPVEVTGETESVQLTLALVREYTDQNPQGVLAKLKLWRWPVPGSNAPESGARLIPAPVQCTVPNDAKFVKALDNANLWLAQQLAKDAPPPKAPHAPWTQHIIAYEIHQPDEATYMLHGPSASAAMALGAAWLMRDWMPDTLGQTLRTLPEQALQKLILSADVVDKDGRLGSVGGAKFKQSSVHALSPYLEPMEAKLFGLHLAKALAAEVNIAKPYAACVGHFDMASVINWLGSNVSELTEPQMQLLQRLNEQRRQVPTDRATTDDSLLLTLDEITKPLLQQVFNAPKDVRTAQAYGLYHWARWARPQAGQIHNRFIPVNLSELAFEYRESGAGEPGETHFEGSLPGLLAKLEHSRKAGDNIDAVLLKGPPGAGKSWLMQQRQQALCLALLDDNSTNAEVPLYLALKHLPSDEDLQKFYAARFCVQGEHPTTTPEGRVLLWVQDHFTGKHPDQHNLCHTDWAWLRKRLGPEGAGMGGRPLRICLDGLNELPATSIEDREHRAREVVWGIYKHLRPGVPMLLGTREHHPFDCLRQGHEDSMMVTVRLLEWGNGQIRHYLERRFEGHPSLQAEAIFKAILQGQPAVLELCRTPLNLSAQCEVLDQWSKDAPSASGLQLARSQAELFDRWLAVRLLRELVQQNQLLTQGDLLTDHERSAIRNRSWTPRSSIPRGRLVDGLLARAEVHWLSHPDIPHAQRGMVAMQWQQVQDWATGEHGWSEHQWEHWKQGIQDLGLVQEDHHGDFSFVHQVWGEYLASQSMLVRGLRPDWRGEPTPKDLLPERLVALRTLLQPAALPGGRSAEQELQAQQVAMNACWRQVLDNPKWRNRVLGHHFSRLVGTTVPWNDVANEVHRDDIGLKAHLEQVVGALLNAQPGKQALLDWRMFGAYLYEGGHLPWPHEQETWHNEAANWQDMLGQVWSPFRDQFWRDVATEVGDSVMQKMRTTQRCLAYPPAGAMDEVLPLALQSLQDPLPWLEWLHQEGLWALASRCCLALSRVWLDETKAQGLLHTLRQQLLYASLPTEKPAALAGLLAAVGPWDPLAKRQAWPKPQANDMRVRAQAADLLGRLGHITHHHEPLRYQVLPGGALCLKPPLWVPVGKPGSVLHVTLGAEDDNFFFHWDPEDDDDIEEYEQSLELLDDPVTLPFNSFFMAAYPVTVMEYARFLDAPDSQNPDASCWAQVGPLAQEWLRSRVEVGRRNQPRFWGAEDWCNPLQPVTGVNWFEAMAYASWLQRAWGLQQPLPGPGRVHLPTEWQWEAAVRATNGTDSWPGWTHAQKMPSPLHFNHSASGWGRPLPVGIMGLSATANGLFDTAGGVYEWCSNASRWRLDDPLNGKATWADERMKKPWFQCALRGGSYRFAAASCMSSNRSRNSPDYASVDIGFRLIVG